MKLPLAIAAATTASAVGVCTHAAVATIAIVVFTNVVRGQRGVDSLLAPPAAEERVL
jgi:hypothetical protein